MVKFMVVLSRRASMTPDRFRQYFKEVHEPMALQILGLRKYVQNFAMDDSKRNRPPWDAIIELYFDDWPSMETSWASPEGQAATDDLAQFADLNNSACSSVEELVIRQAQ